MELTSNRYRKDWRRLLATRRATVLVGVACAVVAAGVLIAAMSSYRSSVSAGGNAETVLVATQTIPKNTSGAAIASQGLFRPTHIAAKQVTAGAIADAAAVQGKVAVHDIYPGEQLTAADFAAGGGLAASLAPSQRAMTVTLDAQHGMIGQLQDGDHVDVYAGVDLAQNTGGVNRPVLRLLMSNVVVLKAAAATSGTTELHAKYTSAITANIPMSLVTTFQLSPIHLPICTWASAGGTKGAGGALRPAMSAPMSSGSVSTKSRLNRSASAPWSTPQKKRPRWTTARRLRSPLRPTTASCGSRCGRATPPHRLHRRSPMCSRSCRPVSQSPPEVRANDKRDESTGRP